MPARGKRSSDGEVVVVGGFLSGLSSAVPTLARFILGDAERSSVQIHLRGLKVHNLARPKPESTRDETDEPRLEVMWRWERLTRFQ
jgi:hypothetical protein